VACQNGGSKFLCVRWLSRGDDKIVEVVNDRGVRIRGKELTAVQVDAWDERGALPDKTVIHPGRPIGGSEVRVPESTFDVVEALAQALDQNPRSFNRAVLVVAGRQLDVGTRALSRAYSAIYRELRHSLDEARRRGIRVRLPSGVLTGPLDSMARRAIFALALDEVPFTFDVDALLRVLGLPSDLLTFPPDPEARYYPSSLEMMRRGLALQTLPRAARTAPREDLDWATSSARTLFSFTILLARYIDLTTSPLPVISNPDPAIVASAQHVLRTLTTAGRALSRLIEAAGAGSAEYLAAFAAPMLLVVLRALPGRARTDLQNSVDRAAVQLPRLLAMISLVKSTSPELRHLLSFDAVERLQGATEEEQAAVQASVLVWLEGHSTEAALLTTQVSVPSANTALGGHSQ